MRSNSILDNYLQQTTFASYEDFMENFKVKVPDNFNFAYDVVDKWAEIEPLRRAMCWTNDQGEHIDFTFADIKRESDQVASALMALGIGAGDMVMLILKRRYEFWTTIIALHKIGAVAIPATHLLTSKDIIYRCVASDIKMIIAAGQDVILDNVNGARAECPSLEYCVSIGPEMSEGWLDFHELQQKAEPFVRPALRNNNCDASLLYFTSGTSGSPKMVVHDFTYPLAHIITASYWHNVDCDSIHLTLADTGWGKAVWGKLYGQWIAGSTVFVYDFEKFDPIDIVAMIEKYNITSFCAPPTVFRFLVREDLSKYDISSLRYCTIAGEALNPVLYDKFKELTGIELMEGFGQTETTLTVATYPWVRPKPGSMGVVNPQYDVDLIDDEGNRVAVGQQGQIVIRTGSGKPLGLFKEYYRDEVLTRQVHHDGIYYTGDVATRDEDGYFWFVGRIDDVIKSSGYRIGPFEVESALLTHPAVLECAVTGVEDALRGQVVKATIVLTENYAASEELIKEIQAHAKRVTAPYKYPRIVEFVDSMPKTISGKIRRTEIRKRG